MFQSMRYIYEVYKEMSFSRAAQKLFISQPSLSAAVKKEEERIGAPIFDRSTNPIHLTEVGQEYIRAVERIMDAENSFESYVSDLTTLKHGALTIGGTNFFVSYVLPPILSRFTASYPAIHITLVEGSTSELTEKLSAGTLDLLLDNSELDSLVFDRKVIQEDHLLMAVPVEFASNMEVVPYALTAADVKAGHHLSPERTPVPMHVFRDDPFLLLHERNDTRERAMTICRENHFSPKIRLELDQQITAYNLACYGMGIAFVGDSLIQNVPKAKNLLFYKLENRDSIRQISFYYKRNRYLSRALATFLEMIN